MDPKPGVKTTEFWLTVVCQIVALVLPLAQAQVEGKATLAAIVAAALLAGLSTAAYTLSRALAKK